VRTRHSGTSHGILRVFVVMERKCEYIPGLQRRDMWLFYFMRKAFLHKICMDLRYLWNRTVQRTTQNFRKLHLHDSCIAPAIEFCRALLSDITVESSPVRVDGLCDVRIIFRENSLVYLEIGDYVSVNLILRFLTVPFDIHM
jgi:hypothetical protein